MADVIVVCIVRFPKDANLVVEGCVVVTDDPSAMHKSLVLGFYGCVVLYYSFDDADCCGDGDADLKLMLLSQYCGLVSSWHTQIRI